MVISFDLNDTLIPGNYKFETERKTMFQRILAIEPIRSGTVDLIRRLEARGDWIYIYTTSYRSKRKYG